MANGSPTGLLNRGCGRSTSDLIPDQVGNGRFRQREGVRLFGRGARASCSIGEALSSWYWTTLWMAIRLPQESPVSGPPGGCNLGLGKRIWLLTENVSS